MSGEEEAQTQKVQSTASTIRAKVLNQQKRADKMNHTTPQGQFSVDPIQAHNFAKAGLSFHTVEALQRFADVRLPNPQGKGKGTGTSTWYDATGKLALLWVPGQRQIDHNPFPHSLLRTREELLWNLFVEFRACFWV